MATKRLKWLALLSSAILTTGTVFAQDSKALIDALVKKGILTSDDAQQIEKDLSKNNAAIDVSTSKGKYLDKLTLSGRLQVQYADIGGKVDGATGNLVATNHFFLRRIYLGAKASLGDGWTGNFNYDFAGSTFDAAFIQWKMDDSLAVDVGFRKVPFGLEEWYTSSGSLKAIERSPATRFFVESNNGRRLGAGSYRTGVYVGGKLSSGLFYNIAVTNPERDESGYASTGVTSAGSSSTNVLSYWGNLGYSTKVGQDWKYTVSGSVGYLPDQGGVTLGKGDNLTVYNAFFDVSNGPFDLQAEYFGSKNDHGVSATKDSKSTAYSIQPAYQFNEHIEGVVRYSYVDSDGRGIQTSDGIRSAPSGGTMDKLSEWFFGANYYFRGNDVKWQLGYVVGESKDTITGGNAKANVSGVRSQMQLNF